MGRAIGAALLLASGAASAYVPTSNTNADITLHWGGATASTLSAMELSVNAICVTDPHILYVPTSGTDRTPSSGGWAVACVTNSTKVTGIVGNPQVLIVKRDDGGSGVGVGPVQTKATDANSGQITFLNLSGNCGTVIDPTEAGAPNIPNPAGGLVPLRGCTATTISEYAEIGTSDIEPDKFFGINTPVVGGVGLPFRTESDRAFAERHSLAALTFNWPVTLNLRNELQALQFPTTSVCNPANADYGAATTDTTDRRDTTNAESEACMPSLTRQEIASLVTGKILSWNLLDPGLVNAGFPDVYVCRRVEGSGSQATQNALITSWPCDRDLKDAQINTIEPLPPDGTFVIGNSGSGDVSNCLRDRHGEGKWAIGVLSVEGRNNGNTINWRYIKIDGVAPVLRNIHRGDYPYFAQQSCQRRNGALPYNVNAARPNDTIANKDRLFDALCAPTSTRGLNSLDSLTKLNNPLNAGANCQTGAPGTVTANQCQSFYTFGQSGWLATPTSTLTFDQVLNTATRPVNAYTREVAIGQPNHCITPVKSDTGSNANVATDVTPNPNWTP
jgi:hypothetical protein